MKKSKAAELLVKKERKVTDGPIRNKERTKQRFINAVGKIFAKEGYTGLNAIKIAATAKLDRKLIYTYFGSLNKLIESYFKEKDFWEPSHNKYIAYLLQNKKPLSQQNILTILEGQLEDTMNNIEFQKIIQWEISEKTRLMRKISDERELMGAQLFNLTDDYFAESDVDLRAILALQVAGIYYLSLHAKINGSTFCCIDINKPEGKKRIEKALRQIINDTYSKAKAS